MAGKRVGGCVSRWVGIRWVSVGWVCGPVGLSRVGVCGPVGAGGTRVLPSPVAGGFTCRLYLQPPGGRGSAGHAPLPLTERSPRVAARDSRWQGFPLTPPPPPRAVPAGSGRVASPAGEAPGAPSWPRGSLGARGRGGGAGPAPPPATLFTGQGPGNVSGGAALPTAEGARAPPAPHWPLRGDPAFQRRPMGAGGPPGGGERARPARPGRRPLAAAVAAAALPAVRR